jgi:hypothetical protein
MVSGKIPNHKAETDMKDELRPEYDLRSLRVGKLCREWKSFGGVIRLEPDVAEVFPDAEALNEALRFLIRVTKENQSIHNPKGDA